MRSLFTSVLLLSTANAWVTISQSRYGTQVEAIRALFANPPPQIDPFANLNDQQTLGYLWTTPSDPTSHEGLGGGLTWAWDPKLCDHLLPRFREDFFFVPFVTCDSVRSAMHRGFASWSDNNARIAFHDVTSECAKLSGTGEAQSDCPLAELWITHMGGDNGPGSASSDTDATVGEQLSTDAQALGSATTSAALALPHAQRSSTFMYTNGVRPARHEVVETHMASISFNQALCWCAVARQAPGRSSLARPLRRLPAASSPAPSSHAKRPLPIPQVPRLDLLLLLPLAQGPLRPLAVGGALDN